MAKKEINSEEIQILPLSEIKLYEDAPFKVRFDENMAELVESIKENGVLVPAIARPHPEGGVELLSGQRRLKACELAEIKEIPVAGVAVVFKSFFPAVSCVTEKSAERKRQHPDFLSVFSRNFKVGKAVFCIIILMLQRKTACSKPCVYNKISFFYCSAVIFPAF